MKLGVLSKLLTEEQKSSTRKQLKTFSAHQRFVALFCPIFETVLRHRVGLATGGIRTNAKSAANGAAAIMDRFVLLKLDDDLNISVRENLKFNKLTVSVKLTNKLLN